MSKTVSMTCKECQEPKTVGIGHKSASAIQRQAKAFICRACRDKANDDFAVNAAWIRRYVPMVIIAEGVN